MLLKKKSVSYVLFITENLYFVLAPAHDHQVMALHKHGHQLGGLPSLFWVSIGFLIIVFHLFLCKLICNEYYGLQDRQRIRYNRP